MKNFILGFVLALVTGSQAFEDTKVCDVPGLKIRYSSKCESYLECIGEEYQVKSCAEGYFFDGSSCVLGKCDDLPCFQANGTFPHPEFCNKFYICNGWKATVRTCDYNGGYDPEMEECRDEYTCTDSQREFLIKNDNILLTEDYDEYEVAKFNCPKRKGNFPHPKLCHVYFKCNNFGHTLKFCQDSQLYNDTLQDCTIETECGNKVKPEFVCPNKTGVYPHPRNCKWFYECSRYKGTLHQCPSNTMFNSDVGECVKTFPCISDDTNVFKCPITGEGKYKHASKCSYYYRCKNGLAQLRTCPKGESWKDDKCVEDERCKYEDNTPTSKTVKTTKNDTRTIISTTNENNLTTTITSTITEITTIINVTTISITLDGPNIGPTTTFSTSTTPEDITTAPTPLTSTPTLKCLRGYRYLPHPTDKRLYLNCFNGHLLSIEECNPGKVFDPVNRACRNK